MDLNWFFDEQHRWRAWLVVLAVAIVVAVAAVLVVVITHFVKDKSSELGSLGTARQPVTAATAAAAV